MRNSFLKKYFIVGIGMAAPSIPVVNAAWLWDFTNPTVATNSTSGSDTRTPIGGKYDATNAVDGSGFDVAPTPVTVNWTTTGGEAIDIFWIDKEPDGFGDSLVFDYDPDGNGLYPTSIDIEAVYSTPITVRASATSAISGFGGATGFLVNPTMTDLDTTHSWYDGNGSIMTIPAGVANTDFESGMPMSFDSSGTIGSASLVGNNTAGGFAGLWSSYPARPLGGTSDLDTYLPHVVGAAPSATIGRQTLSITNLSPNADSTQFRLSFDGGVPESIVPEPSAAIQVGIAALIGFTRRKR